MEHIKHPLIGGIHFPIALGCAVGPSSVGYNYGKQPYKVGERTPITTASCHQVLAQWTWHIPFDEPAPWSQVSFELFDGVLVLLDGGVNDGLIKAMSGLNDGENAFHHVRCNADMKQEAN